MAESLISSPEAPLLGELSSDSETERLYFAGASYFYIKKKRSLSDNEPHGCIFTFTLPLGEVSLHE